MVRHLGLGSAICFFCWFHLRSLMHLQPGDLTGADSLRWSHSHVWQLARVVLATRLLHVAAEGKPQCAGALQVFICIKFTNVPLAKANHKAQPRWEVSTLEGMSHWGHCCRNLSHRAYCKAARLGDKPGSCTVNTTQFPPSPYSSEVGRRSTERQQELCQ